MSDAFHNGVSSLSKSLLSVLCTFFDVQWNRELGFWCSSGANRCNLVLYFPLPTPAASSPTVSWDVLGYMDLLVWWCGDVCWSQVCAFPVYGVRLYPLIASLDCIPSLPNLIHGTCAIPPCLHADVGHISVLRGACCGVLFWLVACTIVLQVAAQLPLCPIA